MANIRSLAFPLALKDGGLATAEDYDFIKGSIYSILLTAPGERVMKYSYGCPDLIFSSVSSIAIALERIRVALEVQLPTVDFDVTGAIDDFGNCMVKIQWSANELPQVAIEFKLIGESTSINPVSAANTVLSGVLTLAQGGSLLLAQGGKLLLA